MKRFHHYIAICLCWLAIPAITQIAPCFAQTGSEYEVKAALIYNFLKFAEFPTSGASSTDPVAVCVCGDNKTGIAMEQLDGKRLGERSITVFSAHDVEELVHANKNHCIAVFMTTSCESSSSATIQFSHSQVALSIGETKSFISDGGMISFFVESGKVRFEINPEAALRDGIQLSSKLLSLARITQSSGDVSGAVK